MAVTLEGERAIEYGFIKERLPTGSGLVLDVGPEPNAELSRLAISRGYTVTAIGLEPIQRRRDGLTFICADIVTLDISTKFDWIICVSTIEHFGLPGRYEVTEDRPYHDLAGMRKLLGLLKPSGKMLLTIPIGLDTVFRPYHRVYGARRLAKLLEGWKVLEANYWAKPISNRYKIVSRNAALRQKPTKDPWYYAVGTFVLKVLYIS